LLKRSRSFKVEERLLEYPILAALIVFAATTTFYIMLYRRISSRCSKPHALGYEDFGADEEIIKLRSTLPGDHAELERLLEELKEIRKKAELLLDERGNSEDEGNDNERSPERN